MPETITRFSGAIFKLGKGLFEHVKNAVIAAARTPGNINLAHIKNIRIHKNLTSGFFSTPQLLPRRKIAGRCISKFCL